jgi:hypothetical protein
MKRLLYVLAAAVVVVSALFFLHRVTRPASPGPVPDVVAQLPADSAIVLYVDLAALRASSFVEQLAALVAPVQQDPEYTRFVAETDFDYARDLDRVSASARTLPLGRSLTVVAEGRFDRRKIGDYTRRIGRTEQREGAEVFAVPGGAPGTEVFFAFPAPNRIRLSHSPSPRAATPSLDAATTERATRIAGSPVFLLVRLAALPKDFSFFGWQSDQLDALLRTVDWVSLAGRPVEDRLKIVLDAESNSPENARQLAGLLDGLRIFAQAALADPKSRRQIAPAVLPLLDSLLRSAQISQTENTVRLLVDVSREDIARSVAASPPDTSPRKK